MTVRLGIVMDPNANLPYKKDNSLAILHATPAPGLPLLHNGPTTPHHELRGAPGG